MRGKLRMHEWSRREELNAPSAEYDSAALTLSYTGPAEKIIAHGSNPNPSHYERVWQNANHAPMEPTQHTEATPFCQSSVIAGNQHLRKAISNFEFAERIIFLVSVIKEAISEICDALDLAHFNSFGYKSVCRTSV